MWGEHANALPMITKQPVSVATKVGAVVVFSVEVNAKEPVTYQWRLNGINIPKADDGLYVIPEARPEDAGIYTVAVSDPSGAVLSDEALLLLEDLPVIEAGDRFEERTFLQGEGGILLSDNIDASRESAEPFHAGKFGNRSVWYSWVADFDGVATFNTRGSAFDTLLAAYSGRTLTRLRPLAGDDDNGGARTSEIQFNVVKGVEYQIAIDGLGGDEGVFVLSWLLQDSGLLIPEIDDQPKSQTVNEGETASFEVTLRQEGKYSFQWYFNGAPIPEAGEPFLNIRKVTRDHVGTYQLWIRDARQRIVKSQLATLELGDSKLPGQSVDKALDLITAGPDDRGQSVGAALTSRSGSSGSRITFALGVGSTVSQTINNSGSVPEPEAAPHCAILGGADRWITLEATTDGMCEVDTLGSAIDTVIAVYEWTGSILSTLSRPVTCNDDIASGVNTESRVLFRGRAGAIYWVALDGRAGAQGVIQFNVRFGLPPQSILTGPPFHRVLPKGSDHLLQAGFAANDFPTVYQWRRDSVPLSTAAGDLLALTNVQIGDSGVYAVEASNFAGATMNILGTIVVDTMTIGAPSVNELGHFGLRIRGDAGQHFKVEATGDFGAWTMLDEVSFSPTVRLYDFVDRDAPLFPFRFYRVVPIWP